MTILALEFSSPLRSVSVFAKGRNTARKCEQGTRETNAFAMIGAALNEAAVDRQEVDCIAVGLGPGSYAGIRIAIAIARGWQLATGVQVAGFSSADCVAHQVTTKGSFSVVLDAQRGEFFAAQYGRRDGKIALLEPFRLMTNADWDRQKNGEMFVRPDVLEDGTSWQALPPDSTTLALMAAGPITPATQYPLAPIYLRPAIFVKAGPAKFAAG
jgi:tRNA threonylcarbamoyl adenosine modification protein YeaZ